MNMIQVNKDTCKQCGLCAVACGFDLINFEANSYPNPKPGMEIECNRCGHCVIVCPTGSLTHSKIPVDKCLPIPRIPDVTPEQCEKLLRSRRSIRIYKNKKVPRSLITRIIDIVGYAPSSCNMQSVRWLVIDKKEQLDSVRNAGIEWLRWNIENQGITSAPIDFKYMLEREEKGTDDLFHHAPVMVLAYGEQFNPMGSLDGVIALAYFDLMANSLGLGCCWDGLFNDMANSFAPMQNVLKIPENNKVWGCLLVGYPKLKFHRYPLRMVPRINWL